MKEFNVFKNIILNHMAFVCICWLWLQKFKVGFTPIRKWFT